MCGDIHCNPGPKDRCNLSILYWNLNSISVNSFSKLASLEAYNSIFKYDLICLGETYLDSSFPLDDSNLILNGYNLIRADHPQNVKRGGVCIYYKDSLPLRVLNVCPLSECLLIEVLYEKKKCIVASLYRSPSQNHEEFNSFLLDLEQLIETIYNLDPYLVLVLGDFNARLSSWSIDDLDSFEGRKIDELTSSYGLSQIISEPTHILPNSTSCIDLIFCNQPNLIIDSGVHSSLNENCHHQLIFAKVNFLVHVPPPYERHIWHYKRSNVDDIKNAINLFDWNRHFRNIDVNKQVEAFNETLLNIFANFVPNESITINEKEPPWITTNIKRKISQKNDLYKRYIRNGKKNSDLQQVLTAGNELKTLINKSKSAYYCRLSNKLSNPKTHPKVYWSILKSLFSNRKTPKIPPILFNGNTVTDFKNKANIFNTHFSNQCSPIKNNSILPINIPPFFCSFSSICLNENKLLNLIRSLDINKSHGHDGISVRMLKMCDVSIVKPLMIIFNNCLNEGTFPLCWKKANITPIYKKGDKCIISNYRPISILPVCGKLFEKMIYDAYYEYFSNNNIINVNQSGFRSGDSCTNQLSVIVHEILKSFDSSTTLDVRGVFLDISKAFDRVWHEGLIYKLSCYGIEGKALKILQSFLNNRYQRVVLNGQSSNWEKINAGVPQGSILGPLLFLIYINDITINLENEVKLFADDTCLFSVARDPLLTANSLNNDLAKIQQWAYQWKMSFNPDVTKQAQEVTFSRKRIPINHPPLIFNGSIVKKSPVQKHLGVFLDEKLSFNHHLKFIIDKATKSIGILRKLRSFVNRPSLLTIYKSFIRSHLDYADVVYDQPHNACFSDKIESIQYNAALAITGAIRGTSKEKLYQELGLEYLSYRRWFRRLSLFYKTLNDRSPSYMLNIIPPAIHNLNTRNKSLIPRIFCRTESFSNSFFPYCIKEWHNLNLEIRQTKSLVQFKRSILQFIRPVQNSIFDVSDNEGVKLLTRLRLGLSHLNKHKFLHRFTDTVNPMCSCNTEVESSTHFLLRCPNFSQLRIHLINEINNIKPSLTLLSDDSLSQILLYGLKSFDKEINSKIINLTIEYIHKSERFNVQLF